MMHYEDARERALDALASVVASDERVSHAALLIDLFCRFRVFIWPTQAKTGAGKNEDDVLRGDVAAIMSSMVASPRYWGTDVYDVADLVWVVSSRESYTDKLFTTSIWTEAAPTQHDKVRVMDRHRGKFGWMTPLCEPPWEAGEGEEAAHVMAYYAAVDGRLATSELEAFALSRLARRERVVVVDLDLDSPFDGGPFAREHLPPRLGVVDYLIEHPEDGLEGYVGVPKSGTIVPPTFHVGRVGGDYLRKLGLVDMHTTDALRGLLNHVQRVYRPDWVLLDCGSGLNDMAGLVMSGVAHAYTLVTLGGAPLPQVLERRLTTDRATMKLSMPTMAVVRKGEGCSWPDGRGDGRG